jgi:hypothetical protein
VLVAVVEVVADVFVEEDVDLAVLVLDQKVGLKS